MLHATAQLGIASIAKGDMASPIKLASHDLLSLNLLMECIFANLAQFRHHNVSNAMSTMECAPSVKEDMVLQTPKNVRNATLDGSQWVRLPVPLVSQVQVVNSAQAVKLTLEDALSVLLVTWSTTKVNVPMELDKLMKQAVQV